MSVGLMGLRVHIPAVMLLERLLHLNPGWIIAKRLAISFSLSVRAEGRELGAFKACVNSS